MGKALARLHLGLFCFALGHVFVTLLSVVLISLTISGSASF